MPGAPLTCWTQHSIWAGLRGVSGAPSSPRGWGSTWGLGWAPVGQEHPQVRGSPPVPPELGREAPAPLAHQIPPGKRPKTPQQRGQAGHQILQRLGRDPLLNLGRRRRRGGPIAGRAGGQQPPDVQRFHLVVEDAAVGQPLLGDHHGFEGAQGAPQAEPPPRARLQPAREGGGTPPGEP